jgi:uncharacterized oligopeptide transporter (OPT) family protein
MATLTSGITSGSLPWHMIIAGIAMGVVLHHHTSNNNYTDNVRNQEVTTTFVEVSAHYKRNLL